MLHLRILCLVGIDWTPARDSRCHSVADGTGRARNAARRGSCHSRAAAACTTTAAEGAQGRNRTNHTRIFSPLLYQLSYLGLRS